MRKMPKRCCTTSLGHVVSSFFTLSFLVYIANYILDTTHSFYDATTCFNNDSMPLLLTANESYRATSVFLQISHGASYKLVTACDSSYEGKKLER